MGSSKLVFNAIGTTFLIDIYQDLPNSKKILLEEKIQNKISIFDQKYSRFKKDSLIFEMARKKGKYKLDSDGIALLDFYKKLYKLTDSLFTPLIGDVLVQAGYDSEYSLKEKKIEKPFTWENALKWDSPILEIKKETYLDFGGIGKGFLIDEIARILKEENIDEFCIDGSGDILYKTSKKNPIKVGLENSLDSKQVIGVANILNESICASSGNRRKWGRFHHIINPKTLSSPENILATWVIAKDTVIADAIATCLFLVDPDKLKSFNFEYLILSSDFSINKSTNFPADLYIIK